jgi:hypothetical protein
MTQDQLSEIKKMEKNIADGHNPNCALCDSPLDIKTPTEGNTGSKGYNYTCPNANCEVKSGFVKIPWYSVILQFATKQLVVVGIVIFTALGGAISYYFNNLGSKADTDKDNETPTTIDSNTSTDDTKVADLEKLLSEKDEELGKLNQKIKELENKQKQGTGISADDKKLIWEAKRRIGVEMATADRNTSKRYLFDVLNEYDKMGGTYKLTDAQQNDIMEILSGHIISGKLSMDELQDFENLVLDKKYSAKGRRFEHLGHAYFYMSEELNSGSKGFYDYRAKALLQYLKFVNNLRDAKPSSGVLQSLQAAYDSVKNSDSIPKSLKKNKVKDVIANPLGSAELPEYIRSLEAHLQASN